MKRSGFKMRSGNTSTFKMMGSSPMHIDPTDPKDKVSPPSDRDELVTYTDTSYHPDWGGTTVTPRETMISLGTKRLIEAGAPKDVIDKSKLRDIKLFKAQEK